MPEPTVLYSGYQKIHKGNVMYRRGRAYEYRIMKKLREQGYLVIRSAGSHSPIDLVAISPAHEVHGRPPVGDFEYPPNIHIGCVWYDAQIKLIQCKSGKSSKSAIKKVEQSDIKRFEGLYSVVVEVL